MSLWADRHASTIDVDRFRAHDQFLEQADSYPYEALTGWIAANTTKRPGIDPGFKLER